MIKQFIPQEVCLKCQGCCRFKEQDSVWSPCLLDEEIQNFLDKNIPPLCLSLDKKLMPIPNTQGQGHICPLFDVQVNKCKIYEFRPFECQLYPFLISLRNKKIAFGDNSSRQSIQIEGGIPPRYLNKGAGKVRFSKVLLTVDLNCPYIKEKINSREFKEYTDYLTNFLNSPKQLELLKDNPHIIRAYEEVLDVIELNI
jgi:Fe-S-cluster containining protein